MIFSSRQMAIRVQANAETGRKTVCVSAGGINRETARTQDKPDETVSAHFMPSGYLLKISLMTSLDLGMIRSIMRGFRGEDRSCRCSRCRLISRLS